MKCKVLCEHSTTFLLHDSQNDKVSAVTKNIKITVLDWLLITVLENMDYALKFETRHENISWPSIQKKSTNNKICHNSIIILFNCNNNNHR